MRYYYKRFKKAQDWPIVRLLSDFEGFKQQIAKALTIRMLGQGEAELRTKVMYSIQKELDRLKGQSASSEWSFWNSLKRGCGHLPIEEVANKMIKHYVGQLISPFRIIAFLLAKVISRTILGLFHFSVVPKSNHQNLKDQIGYGISVVGASEKIRQLDKAHTLVFIAPHISQFDTLYIEYTIDRLEISFPSIAVSSTYSKYGISNLILKRLGLFLVSFKKRPTIVLVETFKMVFQYMIANGVNNLFYPSGVRSKTGEVEINFKTGLLKQLLHAQMSDQQKGGSQQIYLVPIIVNYSAVFEAQYLIDRGIKTSNASARLLKKMSAFARRVFRSIFFNSTDVEVSIGEPFLLDSLSVKASRNKEQTTIRLLQDIKKELRAQFIAQQVVRCSHLVAYTVFRYFH